MHSGDLSEVVDFSTPILPWASEESEFFYLDCMYPEVY